MKKTIYHLIFISLLKVCLFTAAFAQQEAIQPKLTLKWAPAGLLLGNVSLQSEYSFGKRNSFTTRIGVPANAKHTLQYEGREAAFNLKAISFLTGYRRYLSKKHLKGLYLEPYFKYVHQTGEGTGNGTLDGEPVAMQLTNNYNGAGVGLQLGTQFLIGKRFVIDLFFLGPEINSAANKFKAVEMSKTLPWNTAEAADAEQEIRRFMNQFPFIRNRTTIMADRSNRTVNADFKGALPGFRAGISLGVAL